MEAARYVPLNKGVHVSASALIATHVETEFPLTRSKQTSGVDSNRNKITSLRKHRFQANLSPCVWHGVNQETFPKELYLLEISVWYSCRVTRVPPNGLRATAPARPRSCERNVYLSRNDSCSGAFPSTDLNVLRQ